MSAAFAPTTHAPASEDDAVAAILRVLTYADQFGQAVSTLEILRFLDLPLEASTVRSILRCKTGESWLNNADYYCLPGRPALFAQTLERARVSQQMWPRAYDWARSMASVPGVRMLAVTGSLAMDNFAPGADIDFFVLTSPGRVWTARLCLVALVRLARFRGVELCPNYILGTSNLCLPQQTYGVARELAQMVPLYGGETYRQMLAANNWMLRYLPVATTAPTHAREISLTPGATRLKALGERITHGATGQRLEDWERTRKIARLRRLPGGWSPEVILNAEQCKGHFRSTGAGDASAGINPG